MRTPSLRKGFRTGFRAGLVALCACGSSTHGSPPNPAAGTVVGSIRGTSYGIADAISGVVTMNGSTSAFILMSTDDDLCDRIASNTFDQDEQIVGLTLFDSTAGSDGTMVDAAPTAPGTYTLGVAPHIATFSAHATDGNCADIAGSVATGSSGTVTLAAVDSGAFSGSFDLVLNSGDHITGTFDPTACPAIADELTQTAPPSCH